VSPEPCGQWQANLVLLALAGVTVGLLWWTVHLCSGA
jgi:hypothetical protein